MESAEKELLQKLMAENPELKTLVDEHQAFEAQLEDMDRRHYLSPEEDLERKKIQKSKLAAKDKIQHFIDSHTGNLT